MKQFNLNRLPVYTCTLGMLVMSTQVEASGFQLWEQDAASIGEFHAGYAAKANDASTSFYNPAGIPRIKNQQIIFSGAEAMSDFKYDGTISVTGLKVGEPQPVVAQGGASAFIPSLHYIAPLTEKLGFGFSVVAPFGSKIDYGRSTYMRYAVVQADLKVVDVSASLGYQVTDKISVGAGVDVQPMHARFDQVGVNGDDSDTDSTTKLNDTAYGGHLGALYQYAPNGRVGISYHTQVVHHLTGTSDFAGPLTVSFNEGKPLSSPNANTNMTMPAYTAISIYQEVHPKIALMGSAIYTQWNVIKQIILNDVAGINEFTPSVGIQVYDPQYFRNTWNVSVGANYFVSEKGTLRAGIGYDQTPTNDTYRNVLLPDNNRYAIALGGHYRQRKQSVSTWAGHIFS